MKEVLRNTLAAMAGALTGIVLLRVLQMLGARFYPLPADVNSADKAAMAEFIRQAPLGALLFVLLSYFVGVAVGAWVAGRLSLTAGPRQAIMVTLLFLAASALNLLAFPHPAWFWVANFAVILFAAWLALRFLPATANSPSS